ncbi:3',5'-cyclic adenosine monophosphate phosphodiesterase CpdA [Roseovarius litorisediminis]|uniref:3',5'-cyclic adenosine monophosphate phosphodiesterase CpdA n=1 Tax=Roseovarius litorisediminis TaxID=1312363 RepID=A0A1Y5S1S1_9RHOB|nr:phosphodiesterase [Roseovarius litorisediminis]SLN30115.1 3',5'-cyclic adenosine monophosphate phosphodiesterase CpdA [Roseovarius litorisediminis]
MKKLLVFTDIHFVPEGETIIGLDPAERFAMGLGHALKNHADAERIIITGDLSHNGHRDEYKRLRTVLENCPLPVHLMVGNHDRRQPFLEVFPETPITEGGYIQQVVDIGHDRLILLDTQNEEADDTHSGHMCAHRLEWLEKTLADAPDRRITVFTHHPPILTGFKGMDWIGFHNRAEMITRLTAHGNIAQIISGHVHRTILGSAGGIPTAIFKSTCHQMPMALGYQDSSLAVDEPGAYGLLLLDDDGIVVHTEDFTLPETEISIYN